jgi:hypothetical protein
MSPAIEPKRPYTKPRVTIPEKESIGRTGIKYTTSAGDFYARHLTPEQIAIITHLKEKGLRVEDLFLVSKVGENQRYTINRGDERPLPEVLLENRNNPKVVQHLFNSIINFVVTMHNEGIYFNHPRFENFTVDKKGNVRIIDFKFAKYVSNANLNPEEYFNKFISDFGFLHDSLKYYKFDVRTQYNFFRVLINKYNVPKAYKEELLNKIVTFFINRNKK